MKPVIRQKAVKAEAMLGFAQAAGKVVSGDFAVTRQLRMGNVHLVIIATDGGRRVERRFGHLCDEQGVPWRRWGTKEQLGRLLGKSARSVVAVLDPAFAAKLEEAVSESREGSGPNDLR